MKLEDKIAERRQEAEGKGRGTKKAKVIKKEAEAPAGQEKKLVTVADEKAFIIPIDQIEVQTQARKTFFDLEGLAKTINERGQLQPIVLKKIEDEKYLLVDGERRLRAIREILKQKTIRAVLQDVELDGSELRLTQLIANRQRDDYPPMELAEELKGLKDKYNFTDSDLADRLGMNKSWIYKQRSLADAPPEIKDKIRSGSLAATTYLNNKIAMHEKRSRKVFLKLPYDDAVNLAKLLQKLSEHMDDTATIDVGEKPRKKELLSILTQRAVDLLAQMSEEEKDQ